MTSLAVEIAVNSFIAASKNANINLGYSLTRYIPANVYDKVAGFIYLSNYNVLYDVRDKHYPSIIFPKEDLKRGSYDSNRQHSYLLELTVANVDDNVKKYCSSPMAEIDDEIVDGKFSSSIISDAISISKYYYILHKVQAVTLITFPFNNKPTTLDISELVRNTNYAQYKFEKTKFNGLSMIDIIDRFAFEYTKL
jgi:hypothetical protein